MLHALHLTPCTLRLAPYTSILLCPILYTKSLTLCASGIESTPCAGLSTLSKGASK